MSVLARAGAALAAGALAIGVAGCGGGGSETSNASGESAKQPGKVALPKGDPIVFYDITDATGLGAVSAAISQFTTGEKVAQDYINAKGGIGGRPVVIKACDAKADPAATTACAQEAIKDKAVAKLGLSVAWGENGFPVLKRAGIPSLNPPVNPQDLRDGEGSFVTGGSSEFEAQVQYIGETMKAKKLTVFADDNPTGQDQVNRVKTAVKAYGFDIDVQSVLLPAGTADPTSYVAKAVQGNPDAIMTNQSGAQGVSAYTAFAQQGYPASKILNQGGAVDFYSFLDKVDANAVNGALFTYAFESFDDTTNEEVKTYRDAMQKYAGTDGRAEFLQWGFSNVVTLAAIAEKIGADKFDAASLKAFLRDVDDFPMNMAQPLSRKYATKEAPAAIRPQVQIVRVQDGKLETVRSWFNPYEQASR